VNGVHDLGGMHGFGPVCPEEDEPTFHEAWEGRVFAIIRAARAQGLFNVDEFRHAIERMEPAHYLATGYYEHWLASAETNLAEKGIVSRDELERQTALIRGGVDAPATGQADPELRGRILGGGGNPDVLWHAQGAPARFAVGDAVVARNLHPAGHTRLPRYVRGKRGIIHKLHGIATFLDTNAHGLGQQPRAVYSVRFAGRDLWGDSAAHGHCVFLDLWDSYLDPT